MDEFYRIKRLPPYVFANRQRPQEQGAARGEDVIDLGMGNPDMPTPKHIVDKLVEAAKNPKNHRYSASRGITRLRVAMTKWYRDRYAVELDPDSEVIATIGAKEGMAHLALAVLQPGDGVLVPNPTYPIHSYSVVIADGDLRSVPLTPDGRLLRVACEETARLAWPEGQKLLILSFPHNPTTMCVDRDFFVKVVDFAREHRLMVVHDFAYADFTFDGYQPPSFLEVPGRAGTSASRSSRPSKSYNMAGLAARLRLRQRANDQRPRPHQVVSRLRRLPAHPDRRHHRARGRPDGASSDIVEVHRKRRATCWSTASTRSAGAVAEAQGHDVRLGADPRGVPRPRLARSSPSSCIQEAKVAVSAGHRLRRVRRGLRPLRARGERAAHPAGAARAQEPESLTGPPTRNRLRPRE